jgi:hypothetical protein
MKASMTKANMDSSIKRNSGTAKALLSIPGAILSPNAGHGCYDEAIANRTIGQKLTSIMSKK